MLLAFSDIVMVNFSEDNFKNHDLHQKTTFNQERIICVTFILQQNLRTASLDLKFTGS